MAFLGADRYWIAWFMFSESHGRTPLIWAADRGQLSAVEILLAKGAEINAQVCLKRVFVYMLDLESRSCIFRQNYLTEYQ
jgi:ankyrin repeat protein